MLHTLLTGEFYIAAIVKRHTAGDSNGTYDVKYTDGSIGEFLTQAKHGLIPMPVVARHSKSKSSSSHKVSPCQKTFTAAPRKRGHS